MFTIPENLVAFMPLHYTDTVKLARQIMDGTYDEREDSDRVNIVIYHTLSEEQKPKFYKIFLKHIPIE